MTHDGGGWMGNGVSVWTALAVLAVAMLPSAHGSMDFKRAASRVAG